MCSLLLTIRYTHKSPVTLLNSPTLRNRRVLAAYNTCISRFLLYSLKNISRREQNSGSFSRLSLNPFNKLGRVSKSKSSFLHRVHHAFRESVLIGFHRVGGTIGIYTRVLLILRLACVHSALSLSLFPLSFKFSETCPCDSVVPRLFARAPDINARIQLLLR